MADVETKYPPYVTDGNHIYLWHPEYERLFNEGKLKASEPPVIQKNKPMSARQKTKLEEARKKALADAERAVLLLKPQVQEPETEERDEIAEILGATGATGATASTDKIIDLDE